MSTLPVIPDLAMLKNWLERLDISCFECDGCEALHLPHMQNIGGIFDAKIDLIDNVVLFSALAEIKPSVMTTLIAELSQINASSLTMKAFVEVQDDNIPILVLCQSLSASAGVTLEQFNCFLQEAEDQTAQIILEACSGGWLLHEYDDGILFHSSTSYQLH